MPRSPLVLALLLLGCGDPSPPPASGAISLSWAGDAVSELELPSSSRSGPAPERWPLGEVERAERGAERDAWSAPLPARLLFYQSDSKRRPPGLRIFDGDGRELPFDTWRAGGRRPRSWSWRDGQIVIWTRSGQQPPAGLQLAMPEATAAEDALNLETSGLEPGDFALRSVPAFHSWRRGVYLPAPGRIAWRLTAPAEARLSFRAQLLTPALDEGARSDGAAIVIEIEAGGRSQEIERIALSPGDDERVRVDLSRYAGQAVVLRIRTEPGETAALDYVLLGDPALYTPREDPRRVQLFFVDTLRADHLGAYGYGRDTSPHIDAWAARGALFTQARAPSPWTLPSGRTSLTGRWPDRWGAGPHLGQIFGEAGWATAAVVTNRYLTDAFGLAEAWGSHRSGMGVRADRQVGRAKAVLAEHPDRDLLLLVHLIDPHMPYNKRGRFRDRLAGPHPEGLAERVDEANVEAALEAAGPEEADAIREYVVARYDQNVMAADAAFEAMREVLGSAALTILYADHGEEFWDHGGLGHGHTLLDELVRVPLVIGGPGVPAGRLDAPATLADVAPTAMDWAGIPAAPGVAVDGASLLPLIRGEPGAAEALADRPQPLVRTLFGDDAWGAVVGAKKWIASGFSESLYDLAADPGEETDLASTGGAPELQPWRDALADALGRPVAPVWRVAGPGDAISLSPQSAVLSVRPPEGGVPWSESWGRWDSKGTHAAPVVDPDGAVHLRRQGEGRALRELYLMPAEGASPDGIEVTLSARRQTWSGAVPAGAPRSGLLLQLGEPPAVVELGWSVQPAPAALEQVELSEDVKEALQALGYVE